MHDQQSLGECEKCSRDVGAESEAQEQDNTKK